jgi:DNA adenine methylase
MASSDRSRPTQPSVRPFLKWAGGKRQLLPVLRRFYPREFRTYCEPFLGSGAVFFDLHNRGDLKGRRAILIDNNPDLVGCYSAVRDHVEEVIAELQRLARQHGTGGAEFFYDVRDREFNPGRRRYLAGGGPQPYPARLAAMLIYLNRTGFNGLFRLNASGEFNVPAGRYPNPQICDADNLRRVCCALSNGVQLLHGTFEMIRSHAGSGDFVYFDPPYAPVSRTARFTSYTASGFGPEAQAALQRHVIALAARGARVLLSNSVAPEIRQLYADSPEARRAGLTARMVPARRAINSRAELRGAVREYLITNVRSRGAAAAAR